MITGPAMLTFLSPWWAVGAVAAVGLPLLAHLLSRSRYREVLFPATRFVRLAVEQTTRIEKPRHRLLMLLRWLLLLLVVVAFMRPRWQPQAAAQNGEDGVWLVVMLDASASMRRVDAGSTLYERAQREAAGVLDQLDPARDVATVIHVGREARPLLPEPTANLSLLRERLSDSEPTYESADWQSAVAAVERIAEASGRPVRIVVISDQQGDGSMFDGGAAWQRVAVRHLPLEGPAGNASVRLMDAYPYPAVSGQAVNTVVEVAYDGDTPRDLTLTATLAGSRVQRTVPLQPGGKRLVELSLPAPDREGVALLRIAIEGEDPIDFDNAAGLPLRINRQSRAMVIHGPAADDQRLAERVAAMLRPGNVEGLSLPEVDTVPDTDAAARLRSASPAQLRTVVLLEPGRIDDALAGQLNDYAVQGGGVLAFVSDPRIGPRGDALSLPLVPGSTSNNLETDQTAAGIDFSLAPLRIFEGPSRAGLAALAWPGVDPAQVRDDAQCVLATDDNTPIVASIQLGRGRLIAFNTDLSSAAGGLLAEPAFVVLFNELCKHASSGPPIPQAARPGDAMPAVLQNAPRRAVPEGVDADTASITRPGAYLALDSAGNIDEGVWARLDPAESDTRTGKGWADRNANTTNTGPTLAPAPQAAGSLIGRDPPIELWPYFAAAALLLAAGESLALWRFASGRGDVA